MQIRERGRVSAIESFLVGMAMCLAVACSFEPGEICKTLEDLPVTPLTSQSSSIVIDSPNTLQVIHGTGCARLGDGGTLKVEQSVAFPGYVNRATVFVNGWQLGYQSSDHHVGALITTLGKIALERNRLTWTAIGSLSEDDADEAFNWCYRFTALGWNSASLSAEVDDDDALTFCAAGGAGQDNLYWADNDQADTALASFRSYLQNDLFVPYRTIAVLPRGFGMGWADGSDHHILQLAYNLDHAESFVEHRSPYRKAYTTVALDLPGGAHRAGAGYVSWQTYTIMKDNRRRRDYVFGEIVSAMAGADVGVIQPPFSVLPQSPVDALVGDATDAEVVIDNIPYEFAIPMLTGWNIGNGNDQHVKEVGVWIDSFAYQKAQGSPAGTLRYKIASRLRDRDGVPGHYRGHKVTILGLRAAPSRLPGGPP